jgi:hypothetical protein
MLVLVFLLTATSSTLVLCLASVSFLLALAAVPLTAGAVAGLCWWRLKTALVARPLRSTHPIAASATKAEVPAPKRFGYLDRELFAKNDIQRFIAGRTLDGSRAAGDQWVMGLDHRRDRAAHRSSDIARAGGEDF